MNTVTSKSENMVPAPTVAGTACLITGILLAFVFYPQQASEGISSMAKVAAEYVGAGFAASLLFDLTKGLRNLLRTDLLCILGIYALTLAEFLFPQEDFNTWPISTEDLSLAINMTLLGLTAFVLSRHLIKPTRMKTKWLTLNELSSNAIVITSIVCAFLGFLFMLQAVEFKVFGEKGMFYYIMGGRFTQPWSRGRLGGLSSLISELSLLQYIIPPLFGIVINRFKQFNILQFAIVAALFYAVMFTAFAGGTRNVFVAHISTFLMSYLVTVHKNTIWNTILPVILVIYLTGYASYHMLEFRTVGLRYYLEEEVYKSEGGRDTLAVDYNLASMGLVAANMPKNYDFLGAELIVWSLAKPIPRAFWRGKPEGLSVSIEEVAGAEGYTLAVTYLGEAYMTAGWAGVFGVSAFFGALSAWWNRMAIKSQSDYGLVVYALGFFAAGLTMRSMLWFTTAILPVIALIVFRKYGPFK